MKKAKKGRMRAARKSTHRLVKRKTLAREPIDREMGLLARKYPAFAKVYRAFYDQASDRGAELPPKYKALVGLGILAFRGAEQSLVKYIRRAYALGATPAEIRPEHLPPELRKLTPQKKQEKLVPAVAEQGIVLEDVEKKLITEAMERANGNQSKAARLLGISRDTLRYRLKK